MQLPITNSHQVLTTTRLGGMREEDGYWNWEGASESWNCQRVGHLGKMTEEFSQPKT